MKTQLILILLAMCSSVFNKSSDFPSFDLLHSHCAVTVTLPGKLCVEVFNTLITTINDFNAGGDPSHGVYLYIRSVNRFHTFGRYINQNMGGPAMSYLSRHRCKVTARLEGGAELSQHFT